MPILNIQGCISKLNNSEIGVVASINAEISEKLERWQVTECEIRFNDGRTISADQRKKIYATFNDISIWSGHMPDEIKAHMKYFFIAKTGCDYFSLSDVDMTTAKEFLEYLIEFCIDNDIPCKDSLLDRTPDIARYVYYCLMSKRCAICGQKSDLHHVDHVQSDRKTAHHLGLRAMPLCRMHHGEYHSMGETAFNEKYHIFAVKIDKEICKLYKLKE